MGMPLVPWIYKLTRVFPRDMDPDDCERVLGEYGAVGWEIAHVFERPDGSWRVLLKQPAAPFLGHDR